MRIETLRSEGNGTRARVAATVTWEDCDRPVQEVYFETEADFSDSLSCNPHAFLVGCILPALNNREKRLFIDAEICPELRDGLFTAMSWIRHWYYEPNRELVSIEAKARSTLPATTRPQRTGLFFSGGIDSLAALRANRLHFPMTHPRSIKDGILIYGQNIESDTRPETFQRAVRALSDVAQDAQIRLVPIYTNIRSLDEERRLFDMSLAAILSAVAHALAGRLTGVSISSSDSIPGLSLLDITFAKPYGSHPLLDPNYSSVDLRVWHDAMTLSRLDKTRLVADWDVALQNIKVCGPNWPGDNCGQCEKCVRTMLALLALDVLKDTKAFPGNDVSEQLLSGVGIKRPISRVSYTVDEDYLELVPLLEKRGRHDLIRIIKWKLSRYRGDSEGWRKRLQHLDVRFLNGNLARLKKSLFG
ncbi:MAG: hypothetical protein LWX51_01020 [Deltaproteobacteria bacterium]|jgi:hypothetical protein|nr:hypothetical protein [Deltaproteobacteria bacterium]